MGGGLCLGLSFLWQRQQGLPRVPTISPAQLPAHPAASGLRSSLLLELTEVRPETSFSLPMPLAKDRALAWAFGDWVLLELIEAFKPFYFLFFFK